MCPLTLKQGKLKEKRLQQLAVALVQEEAAAAAAKVEEGGKTGKGTKKGEEGEEEGEGGAQPAVARVTVGELRCVFRMQFALLAGADYCVPPLNP